MSMGAHRKRSLSSWSPDGAGASYETHVSRTKDVMKDGVVTTFIEHVTLPVEEHAKTLGMPKDEDYQLKDMLAAGVMPEEVNVRGMLDSSDPTDLSNAGVGDAILDQLASQVKNEPAVSSEPVSAVEPSNE